MDIKMWDIVIAFCKIVSHSIYYFFNLVIIIKNNKRLEMLNSKNNPFKSGDKVKLADTELNRIELPEMAVYLRIGNVFKVIWVNGDAVAISAGSFCKDHDEPVILHYSRFELA